MAGRRIEIITVILFTIAAVLLVTCSNNLSNAIFDKIALAEKNPPIDGGGLAVQTQAITATLTWTKADDIEVGQSVLQYKVVYSPNNDINSWEDAELNGTVALDWTIDIATAEVTGLTIDTRYYFNVVVRDIAGNKDDYGMIDDITKTDPEAPLPAGGGSTTLSISNVGTNSLTVSWQKASDNVTPVENLEYLVVYSTESSDVDTAASAYQNGTHVGTWEQDIITKDVTGLEDYVTYHVNVIVRDEVDSRAVYTVASDRTVKIPRMFWTEQLNDKVRAARLSDNTPTIEINTAASSLPAGIAIDGENRRIYWTDQNNDSIYSMDYDGSNISTVIHSINNPTGIVLAPTGDAMFWIEYSDRQICTASRLTVSGDASTGSYDLITADAGYWPTLVTYDPATDPDRIYWTEIGTEGRIRRAEIDGSNVVTLRSLGGTASPVGIAISGEWVYWTDPALNTVSKVKTDNSGADVLVNLNLVSPYGIAVTANNNEVLWTDIGNDKIYRAPTSISGADADSYALSINTNSGDPMDITMDE